MDSVLLDGDRRISYVRLGEAGRRVLLVLHGMGCGHRDILAMGEAFADRFDVIVPDLPGHGESYRDAARCTLNGSADDIAALCAQLGIDQADVIGHSRGGRVAMALAGRHPDLVRQLVVLDTAIARPAKTTDDLARLYDAITPENFEEQLRTVMMPMLFKPDDRQELVDSTTALMLDAGPDVFKAMGHDLITFDTDAAVKAVQAPTLLVVSDAAPFNAPEEVRAAAPGWQVVNFDLSHHLLVYTAAVNAAIGEFLAA
jgi:3-oxoadipate enol-lactonase/4-carboxymuconolactone decarboxylase